MLYLYDNKIIKIKQINNMNELYKNGLLGFEPATSCIPRQCAISELQKVFKCYR